MPYFVKNRAKTMGCYNLPTVDGKGRRQSLILKRNEVSRALTEEEYKCPEISKGLNVHNLLDVTAKMSA